MNEPDNEKSEPREGMAHRLVDDLPEVPDRIKYLCFSDSSALCLLDDEWQARWVTPREERMPFKDGHLIVFRTPSAGVIADHESAIAHGEAHARVESFSLDLPGLALVVFDDKSALGRLTESKWRPHLCIPAVYVGEIDEESVHLEVIPEGPN